MKFLPGVCLALMLVVAGGHAVAQGVKIGYINPFRIQNESATARLALENLKKEFAGREDDVANFQKRVADLKADLDANSSTMKPDERQAKEKAFTKMATQLQQMQQDLAEDIDQRKREEFGRLSAEANVVIRQIADSGKYDLIVQDAVFSGQRIDITDQVLAEMAKRIDAKDRPAK
ncbi:MAG TPA: OmpH family outer membrane protein [Burkholderiales bacterium]|nr:OmpH family outer membrane protein [Burkholderiales bacterium]